MYLYFNNKCLIQALLKYICMLNFHHFYSKEYRFPFTISFLEPPTPETMKCLLILPIVVIFASFMQLAIQYTEQINSKQTLSDCYIFVFIRRRIFVVCFHFFIHRTKCINCQNFLIVFWLIITIHYVRRPRKQVVFDDFVVIVVVGAIVVV